MSEPTWIKICGVTLPADVELLIDAGVHAIGLNFVSWSKRLVSIETARQLVAVARNRVEIVGVTCDLEDPQIRELLDAVKLDRIQLHGKEDEAQLLRLGRVAFKAVGIASLADVTRSQKLPGDPLLVDTAVGASSGGTGTTFDWSLVAELCRARRVVVAGGLNPNNVGEAVTTLRPFGVDVASGVELKGKPGLKEPALVYQFLEAVRKAESSHSP